LLSVKIKSQNYIEINAIYNYSIHKRRGDGFTSLPVGNFPHLVVKFWPFL